MEPKIFFILFFLFCSSGWSREAVVVTDGAMVYQSADFDSSVISYMQAGRKLQVSQKRFGPFLKVLLRQGVFGYVSDVDLKVSGADIVEPSEKRAAHEQASRAREKVSVLLQSYFGIAVGQVQYTETLLAKEYKETVAVYGLQYTSKMGFMDGPFAFELTALISQTPPTYYKTISDVEPKGMVVLTDATLLFPMMQYYQSFALYMGGGPYLTYSQAKIVKNSVEIPLAEARMGASFVIGAVKKISSFAMRLEPKYFVEKSSYFGAQFSLQYGF